MGERNFNDRVVIVTGGGSGLGQAYCYSFAEEGALVVCPDINLNAAIETVTEIKNKGGKAVAIQTDITKAGEVEKMVQEIIETHDRIDILVNNVGFNLRIGLIDTTQEIWDKLISTNLKGTFLVTKAVVPHMIDRKQGKIVNISSLAGVTGFVSSPYTASKAGIIGMTKLWAMELAPYHICVNCVAPGFIRTPMSQVVYSSPLGKEMERRVPLGVGSISSVVPTVLFLSSTESDYITGQCIVVDGGLSCCHDVGPEFRSLDIDKVNTQETKNN